MANSENMPTIGKDNNVNGLLTINGLAYVLPSDLSVSVSRTTTTQFFQSKAHAPGQNMICILNTGAAYVNPERSYLRIDVTNTGTDPMTFGLGGTAGNLFDRVMIQSRDGSVLERIDNANFLSRIRSNYDGDQEYFDTVLAIAGGRSSGEALAPGFTYRYIIPLSHISPMFSTKQLLPNSLASGMRFDFQLASANKAFKRTSGTTALSYEIIESAIMTESYQLSDLVLRNLNQMSASSGLEYVYNTYFNTNGKRTTTSVNIESRKAVSRALAMVYIENPNVTAAAESDRDSFASGPASFIEAQARVGSLYLPTQSTLRAATPGLLGPEIYAHALLAFNRYTNGSGAVSADYVSFIRDAESTAIFATSLERDTLGGSGIPLSNSRTLAFDATFSNSTESNVNLFLKFTSLARIYLSNVVLEI
jgi:hypothetical protein